MSIKKRIKSGVYIGKFLILNSMRRLTFELECISLWNKEVNVPIDFLKLGVEWDRVQYAEV